MTPTSPIRPLAETAYHAYPFYPKESQGMFEKTPAEYVTLNR